MTLMAYQECFIECSGLFYFNGPALWPTLAPEMTVFGPFCESYDVLLISNDDVLCLSVLLRARLLDMYFKQNEYVDNWHTLLLRDADFIKVDPRPLYAIQHSITALLQGTSSSPESLL